MPGLDYSQISREKLAEVFARSIFTIDGLWFLAVEGKYGLEAAMELDEEVWRKCGSIFPGRTIKNFAIKDDSPLQILIKALQLDPFAPIFTPEVTLLTDNKAVFHYANCPGQEARVRGGMGEFPCKPVGTAYFKAYAEAIDPRIKVTCLTCPPAAHPPQFWCEWQFEI